MEIPPPDESRSEELDRAIAQFTAAFAQAEANRLADRVFEQFLKEFSRELAGDRRVDLLLKALVVCLRSYAERGRVEPELELLLQDWWGNAAFREVGEALRFFALAAEKRGAERERWKIQVALPQLIEQRLSQGERVAAVVCKRPRVFIKVPGLVVVRIFHSIASRVKLWR